MGKNEKLGSDGYSRSAFLQGLETLAEAGLEYQSPSAERSVDEDWALVRELAGEAERETIAKLDRLFANAIREATEEDLRREYRELLPVVERASGDVREVLRQVMGSVPDGVQREAGVVVQMGENLASTLEGHPTPRPEQVRGLVNDFLTAKLYVLEKLRKFIGMQDRFGDPYQPIS